jgi:hypothetical protein
LVGWLVNFYFHNNRNVAQMAVLAFAHLLDDSGSNTNNHQVRRQAAELLGYMARSPLVLGLLEENPNDDDDGPLLTFLHNAAAALLRAGCGGESGAPTNGGDGGDGPCWHEPLLRGLRLLCLESPLARSLLARALVGGGREGGGGGGEAFAPLAALVRLVLSPQAPTASEAVGLLRACLPSLEEEEGGEQGDVVGLWQALAAVMLTKERAPRPPTPPPPSPSVSPTRSSNGSSGRHAATAQLRRSPARRAAAATGAAAARRDVGGTCPLLARLVGEIGALGDEVEVATAGADGMLLLHVCDGGKGGGLVRGDDDGGGDSGGRLALLEVEWRLRSLLSLAALLTHAPAPPRLARAVAGRLRPRALAAVVLGLARASSGNAQAHARRQQQQHSHPHIHHHSAGGGEQASSFASMLGATAAGGAVAPSAGVVAATVAHPSFFPLPPKATEPLEVIVVGCRLLVRGAALAMAAAQQQVGENGVGDGDVGREYARWRSAVLGESTEVAAALCVAWSQGLSRGLLEEVCVWAVGWVMFPWFLLSDKRGGWLDGCPRVSAYLHHHTQHTTHKTHTDRRSPR